MRMQPLLLNLRTIMLDITLLGTSSMMPLPDRALTSAVLSLGGRSILFDCGEGTQTAARGLHVNLMKTDLIALTHYHGDHIFGLPGLIQTMGSMGRERPLTIAGPEGIEQELEPVLRLAGEITYEIRLMELPEEGMQLSQISEAWSPKAILRAFPTEHRVKSQGYVLELNRAGKFQIAKAKALKLPVWSWGLLQRGLTVRYKGQKLVPSLVMGEARRGLKVVFSGDTAPCETLENAARDADLFICEATYAEDSDEELAREHGHSTFAQAAQLAQRANAKRLWLVHFSQRIKDAEEYLPNAQQFFPAAECGTDGKSITLSFEEEKKTEDEDEGEKGNSGGDSADNNCGGCGDAGSEGQEV